MATSWRLTLAATGDAEQGVNLINARMAAEALRRIRGYDCGVLDNSFYTGTAPSGGTRTPNSAFMWQLTASNVRDIQIGRGMATAYGYDIQSERTVHLTATAPASGTAYVFVYLEWDLGSDPQIGYGSIKIYNNGNSSNWTPQQQNLVTNPSGIYQMPLYRLSVNTSGNITGTASWQTLGVLTIGNPLRAEYAGHADSADIATDYEGGGTIEKKFSSLEQRLTELGFKTGSCTPSFGTTSDNVLTKQGTYVKIRLDIRMTYTQLSQYVSSGQLSTNNIIARVPSDFAAASTQYFYAFVAEPPSSRQDGRRYTAELYINGTSIAINRIYQIDQGNFSTGWIVLYAGYKTKNI